MNRLEGKVAIVTGSARGTGAEIARLFCEEGARVCIGDILEEEGSAHAKTLAEAAFFQRLDVRDEASWVACVTAVRDRFGPVDILVNNAAILDVSPIAELDPSVARNILDVNLIGR